MNYFLAADEIATMAADLELKGAALYDHIGAVVADDTVKRIVAWLAEQERQHEKDFRSIAEAHRTLDATQEYSVDVRGMLGTAMRSLEEVLSGKRPIEKDLSTVGSCLQVAAHVEALSVSTYDAMRGTFGSRFTGVLARLVEEEQRHQDVILKVQRRLGLPASAVRRLHAFA